MFVSGSICLGNSLIEFDLFFRDASQVVQWGQVPILERFWKELCGIDESNRRRGGAIGIFV